MFKFPENCNLHTFFQVAASSCSRFNKFQKSSLQGILASNSSLFHGIENINRYSKNAGDTHYVQAMFCFDFFGGLNFFSRHNLCGSGNESA